MKALQVLHIEAISRHTTFMNCVVIFFVPLVAIKVAAWKWIMLNREIHKNTISSASERFCMAVVKILFWHEVSLHRCHTTLKDSTIFGGLLIEDQCHPVLLQSKYAIFISSFLSGTKPYSMKYFHYCLFYTVLWNYLLKHLLCDECFVEHYTWTYIELNHL
jgi:hypothetical protein